MRPPPDPLDLLLDVTYALRGVYELGHPQEGHDDIVQHLGRLAKLLAQQLDVVYEAIHDERQACTCGQRRPTA